MNNTRSLALAVALAGLVGLGSLSLNAEESHDDHDHDHPQPAAAGAPATKAAAAPMTPAKAPATSKDDDHEHDQAGHEEKGHGDEKTAKADDGHAHEEEGHAEEGHEEGQLALSAEQITSAGIELAVASARPVGVAVSFPGEIRFDEDRTAHLVPRVGGVVERVLVELGQPVRKGQVLAVIASPQIADQRSELSAAQRRLETARSTLQREKTLWQDKISAEQDYQLARQAFEEAQINVTNARQKLAVIGAGLNPAGGNRYELVAPFDAMIVEKHLTLGEVVSEASNAFTLSDLSRVWATFGVTAKDLDKVQVGRSVTVTAPDLNAQVEGRVGYVGSLLGEQSRAAPVRVTLANPQGAWRPGLLVNIDVTVAQAQAAVTVPQAALQTVENRPSVFVRNAEGFVLQPVRTGRQAAGYVEILEGLQPGSQVAAAGSFVLKSELGKGSAEHSH
ncbi:efflux RND transporter periplasmic adaptor subunit [Pseudomonas syringae]|nr:efflux RND transporter periplasmic adaptor subunit [Pseudomonas syringae]MBD8791402.1 efflux RND transporter periplasmic adaptor subunit [Pseudomonas syringae]MBD8801464.1 efflux RND transporter periplasmic adaptor subunit [Pseudomonas syringae]MBD8810259.1 efflux RND transporter periplasmic adaptor subunit [Pseudomonas syringae]